MLTLILSIWTFAKVALIFCAVQVFVTRKIFSTKNLGWSFARPKIGSGFCLDQFFRGVKIESSNNEFINHKKVFFTRSIQRSNLELSKKSIHRSALLPRNFYVHFQCSLSNKVVQFAGFLTKKLKCVILVNRDPPPLDHLGLSMSLYFIIFTELFCF